MFRPMAAAPHGRRVRGDHQLPAGRHGLSATFVAQNQRQRIMAALAAVTAEHGYAALTVEDVVARAGVSRRTFYDQFSNKHEAFLAAYDQVSNALLAGVRYAFEDAPTFSTKVTNGLSAFVQFIVSEPGFSHMCIVDVLGAGPNAIERRNAVIQAFAQEFEAAAKELGSTPRPLVSETVVGGIHEVVYSRLRAGRVETLPGLLPDLIYASIAPFCGEEQAERARLDALAQADGAGAAAAVSTDV